MSLVIKNNMLPASDWFDMNFQADFIHSNTAIKKQFNLQEFKVEDDRLSSRVLNHWYETGIISDDRPNGKGWKKFSLSELVWVHIVFKLRSFGLNLEKIREVKNQIDFYNSDNNLSKCPLLDFFMLVAISSKVPVKLIVFESGQAELVRQIDIDIANELDFITEDFISIDLNKILNKILNKKSLKADYLSYSDKPKSPLIKQIEDSLTVNDIQSLTIRVKDKDYLIDEEFFTKDRSKANALMSVLKFGELVEKKNNGKSTFQVKNRKKINK